MHVTQLWRHPVKSLQGEEVGEAAIDADGLRADRQWGVRDLATGRVLTGRREPRLLDAVARVVDDEPELDLPDGTVLRGVGPATDEVLSAWLGTGVTLVHAAAEPPLQAEAFSDPTDDTSTPFEWTMPPGRFVDAYPLLVVTTASLRAAAEWFPEGDWDVRRFRPNVVIETDGDGFVEDTWCGRTVRVGEVEIAPERPCSRCTMVTRPQPGLGRDLDIYRTLARHHGGTFGVWSTVRTPGVVRSGDVVEVV